MAQFYTDFSEYPTGQQPNDWTSRWDGDPGEWTVQDVAGATGGRVLQHTATFDGRRILSWDTVGAVVDAEIVVRIRSSSTAWEQFRLYLRAAGASSGVATAYYVELQTGEFRVRKHVNGADTGLNWASYSWLVDTWYWIRFRAYGDTLQARVWKDGDPEPETWIVEAVDTDITAAGWVGAGNYYGPGVRQWDLVGVGTAGDPAPTSPPSGGPLTKTLTETASLSDALVNKAVSVLAEALSFADALGNRFKTGFAEALAFADTIRRKPGKGLVEGVSVAEASRLRAVKPLAEGTDLAESVTVQLVAGLRRVLAEGLDLAESLSWRGSRLLSEVLTFAEAAKFRVHKVLAEVQTLADSAGTFRGLVLTEFLGLADSLGTIRVLFLAEVVGLIEGFRSAFHLSRAQPVSGLFRNRPRD